MLIIIVSLIRSGATVPSMCVHDAHNVECLVRLKVKYRDERPGRFNFLSVTILNLSRKIHKCLNGGYMKLARNRGAERAHGSVRVYCCYVRQHRPRGVVSCRFVSKRVVSCRVVSRRSVLSCRVVSCRPVRAANNRLLLRRTM